MTTLQDNSFSQPHKIHLLPEHIIDQIKAGEVLERPASLIKELIENSLDAESTSIDLHIVDNGLELLHIQDNGSGIDFQDLPFAFLRHATSKIKKFDDLYRLHSYGFRGEALASVASSSRMTCTTRSKNSSEGAKIIIHGGEQKFYGKQNRPHSGTSFFIKDLFYNTPVRLKFIKSKISEKKALKKIIHAYILVNPQCRFSLRWDESHKIIFPIAKSSRDKIERIKKIFFPKSKGLQEDIHYVSKEYEEHKISGYFSTFCGPGHSGKKQYLFINNRPFEDRALHISILRHLSPYWENGYFGHYCFFIEAPPRLIDVNVHPNKSIVKICKASLVHSIFGSCLKEKISELKKINQPQKDALITPAFLSPSKSQNNTHFDHKIRPWENEITSEVKTANPQDSLNLIALISDQYWMVQLPNHLYYLVDQYQLLRQGLKIFWSKSENLNEEKIIPLLISEPFKPFSKRFDPFLPVFKKFGLLFDRINQETLLLRTIPLFLNSMPYPQIIEGLLLYCQNHLNDQHFNFIDIFDDSHLKITTQKNWNFTQLLLNTFQVSSLNEKNIITELNHDKVFNLFHSSFETQKKFM